MRSSCLRWGCSSLGDHAQNHIYFNCWQKHITKPVIRLSAMILIISLPYCPLSAYQQQFYTQSGRINASQENDILSRSWYFLRAELLFNLARNQSISRVLHWQLLWQTVFLSHVEFWCRKLNLKTRVTECVWVLQELTVWIQKKYPTLTLTCHIIVAFNYLLYLQWRWLIHCWC